MRPERVVGDGAGPGLGDHVLLVARDGSEQPIEEWGAPIRNREGQIIGVVLVFRDVTEHRTRGGRAPGRGARIASGCSRPSGAPGPRRSGPIASRTTSWPWCRTSCARR